MSTDVYQTHEAELTPTDDATNQEFYVVAPKKFLMLFFATTGIYSMYWFYKNWQQYKLRHDDDCWPIARAIFAIFFTHSLFSAVDVRINNLERQYDWKPDLLATFFIIFAIVDRVFERMAFSEFGTPYTNILSLLTLPILTYILYKAQLAINEACGDPLGESNAKLTVANYAWLLLGVFSWSLLLLGLAAMLGFITF